MGSLQVIYLLIFTILSLKANAEALGFSTQYQLFLEENVPADSSDDYNEEEVKEEVAEVDFVKLSPYFDFTQASKDFLKFKLKPLDGNILQNLANILKEKQLVDAFDNSYQELQETCFLFEEDQQIEQDRCLEVLDIYDQIFEVVEGGERIDGLKNLFGVTQSDLDAEVVTENYVSKSDVNYELLLESVITLNRNSPLQKGYTGPRSTNQTSNEAQLEKVICEIENYLKILDENTDLKVYFVITQQLEITLMDENRSQSDKVKVFCVLKKIYEATDNIDAILVLYLKAPEGENLCQ